MSEKKAQPPKRLTTQELAQRVFGKRITRRIKQEVLEVDGFFLSTTRGGAPFPHHP